MPEEKIDGLEGLDDFGDDFGVQLDSFMENDGEDESDSELDSFFEDLSTIDDLEGDDDSEDSADEKDDAREDKEKGDDDDDFDSELEDEASGDDEEFNEEKSNEQIKKKGLSNKGFPLKPVIISILTGLLLGVITVVVLYIVATPAETPVSKTVVELPPEPVPVPKVSKPEPKKLKPKLKPKSKPKKRTYYVQVVSCISREWVHESRLQLKSLGYKSRVRTSSKSSGIAEVLSENLLGEENSAKMVNKINSNNPLAGHAFRKSVENGFRVSLGLFPDLETANRVRTYLNQAFNKEIFFKIQRTTRKIRYQAVQIGGFKSRKDAEKLRNKLKKINTNFDGAFVKSDLKG